MESLRLELQKKILSITPFTFDAIALEVFHFQYQNNKFYRNWVDLLGIEIKKVNTIEKIPFLPIGFFKSHIIKSLEWEEEKVFTSSGTTGAITSRHFVRSLDWYKQISKIGFEQFYGELKDFEFYALLPSYLEREGSSLVKMLADFIEISGNKGGFYLYNHEELLREISNASKKQKILVGVTYALLDLAEKATDLSKCTVMETGGMKGKRKEMIREDVHDVLCKDLKLNDIHSEYGMTELLSQAYSKGAGIFECTKTIKVLVREATDPLEILPNNKSGLINIIDLGNLDTCSFIATDDIGIVRNDQTFRVLGRMDGADIRGCNLMVS